MYTGEQPIFSTKAHVFHMDQETRKIWIQISKHAASVHFYYDSARSTYRIISVEDSKAVVNSTVTPNMTFTKTSLKFGQWSDPQASTVYGLGFSCEQELTRFHECFEEVKELTKKALQAKAEVNGCREESSVMLEHPSPIRQFSHHRTSSLSSIPVSASSSQERRGSFSSSATSLPSNSTEAQMKYENDRLKIALAQSSSNAKKWEIELQTLKNNNVRLTTALQESTTNVEEWKKQLAAYKDENLRLRKMIQEKDNVAQSSDQTDTLQQDLSSRLQQLQLDSSQKQEEIDNLHQRIKELSGAEAINATLKAKIQKLDDVNRDLAQKVDDLQCLLQDTTSNHEKENWEILDLQGKLGDKISEIYEIHELVISSLKKESQS